jgi:hypothetical protein
MLRIRIGNCMGSCIHHNSLMFRCGDNVGRVPVTNVMLQLCWCLVPLRGTPRKTGTQIISACNAIKSNQIKNAPDLQWIAEITPAQTGRHHLTLLFVTAATPCWLGMGIHRWVDLPGQRYAASMPLLQIWNMQIEQLPSAHLKHALH